MSLVVQSDESKMKTLIHETSGGRWGGETVNENFEFFMCDVSRTVRRFVLSFKEPIEEWDYFIREYQNMKCKMHRKNPSITLGEELVEGFEALVGESIFEGFGENTNMKVDRQNNKITFDLECLQERRFDDVFEYLQKGFVKGDFEAEWEEFYETYKHKERLFMNETDRQHDVVFKVKSKFIRAFKEIYRKSLDDFFPRAGIKFDSDKKEITIPSHVMRWGYYDDYILPKGVKLSRFAKSRAEIWRSFMERFALATYKFDSTNNLRVKLGNFPNQFRLKTGSEFLSDSDSEGIVYDSAKKVLRIDKSIIKEKCFDRVLKDLVSLLKQFYDSADKIKLLYLVGGFGKSQYVQKFIKRKFAEKRDILVLIPKDASLSVLQGSLEFAYSRVSTTENASRATLFVMSNDSPCILVRRNQVVKVSEILRQEIEPTGRHVEVYATSLSDPKSTRTKSKLLCRFLCNSDEAHYITVCFSAQEMRIFLDEKDTGHSQVKVISNEVLEKECTIL